MEEKQTYNFSNGKTEEDIKNLTLSVMDFFNINKVLICCLHDDGKAFIFGTMDAEERAKIFLNFLRQEEKLFAFMELAKELRKKKIVDFLILKGENNNG